MATEPGQAPKPEGEETRLRIYLLPNLLTAGNLFCGFLALTKIVEADISDASFPSVIRHAIFFIIWPASSICWTDAWRAWAGRTARSGANLIRWPTSFPLAQPRRFSCTASCYT